MKLPRFEYASPATLAEAVVLLKAAKAAAASVDPPEDLHASAAYRRALVEILLARAAARLGPVINAITRI